jgi:NTE family protein
MLKRNHSALFRRVSLGLVLCALSATPATAQLENKPACDLHAGPAQISAPASDSERPTIGLVLGGGGARGPAHIGVLKVLRDLRVPIDYVGGTSMGAVIGALFSLGMSPEEIEARILAVDWDDLFSDPPDRLQRTYRRKQDDRANFLPLEFGFTRSAFLTNRGLIAGQKFGFVFPDPELYISGYQGFDELAYPFRAVATDLKTGELVVLDHGNLLQAIRASMSIPGVFPPVQRQGRHLIDGGVINNLPVDVVRDMGADIVIAVDVGNLPEETSDDLLGSIPGILSQTLIIQARHNVLAQMENADIVIQVGLKGLAFKDFKRVGETIEPGIRAATAQADRLSEYSVGEAEYAEHLAAHRLPAAGPIIIDRIELENTSPAADEAVRRLISQQVGHPLDLERLKLDLTTIFDFGVFELVDFSITERSGQTILTITASGNSYAPHVFKAGLSFNGDQRGKTDLSARLRYSWMELNRFGGEWRSDLHTGRVTRLQTEFFQPIGWGRALFFALGGRTQYSVLDYFDASERRGEYNLTDHATAFGLGSRLGKWGEVRAGLEYGFLKTTNKSGLGLDDFRGWRGGYTGILGVDLMDEPIFPRSGIDGQTKLFLGRETFGSPLHYTRLEGRVRGVTTLRDNTFQLGLRGGSDLDTGIPQFDEFTIGGMYRLSGYLDSELRGKTYGIASLQWYRQIYGSPGLFSTSYLIGLGVEAGNAWQNRDSARIGDLRYCLNVSLMANTALGPVILSYGQAEAGHSSVYLSMGSYSLPE